MRSVEVSAKTKDDAIAQALAELGVERHEVEIEILDPGSSGFLGFGARNAQLRVSSENAKPLPKKRPSEPAKERPQQGRGERQARSAPPKQAGPDEGSAEAPRRRPRGERRGGREQGPRREAAGAGRSGREESPRGEAAGKRRGAPARERSPEAKTEAPRPTEKRERQPLDAARGGEAAALLAEVISLMGLEASVAAAVDEEGGTKLVVDSPDSAILIGRKGRNLGAMQYLINRMCAEPGEDEDAGRIIVDVEDYLDRRRSALEDMAKSLAGRAKERGHRVRVKPLNPQERRVIHLTLQDDPEVRTFSVGNSVVRSVIIAPTNERRRERSRGRRPRRGDRPRADRATPESGPNEAREPELTSPESQDT
jgi:spoIIIJ-associated protein